MLKSKLTCSYCSRIFKDPILLPCDDSICSGHLNERDVVRENKIKCNKCNQEFQVKEHHFESNEALKQLIESQSYLSEDEISLKQKLEESISKFFEFYDKFQQNRTKLNTDVYNHFGEMRFKINQHGEELKKRIDDISLAMVDQTKKYEALYLKTIKETFSLFDVSKALANELTEDTFRNPNILIESIREIQQKQDESLKDIQSKLNQMNRVKEFCVEKNTFQPNLASLLNQIEKSSLFGVLKFSIFKTIQYSNINSLKSQILEGEQQCSELIRLCEFSLDGKWSLLYRGTRDGFDSDDFHSKCDGYTNTLTILKAEQSSNIFGGFTSVEWDSSDEWKSDPNAFLFSLTNNHNQPLKMKVDPNRHQCAIYCHSSYGPSFGFVFNVANNANTTMDSYCHLGFPYPHPQYRYDTNEAKSFLAGSNNFQLAEIEVYQRE